MHTTDAEIVCVHACAGCALVENHQLFALLKSPKRRGKRSNIHCLRCDVEKMGKQASDFAVEHADQLATPRHFEPDEPFRCEPERVFLLHRRARVEPVKLPDCLKLGPMFHGSFGTAMKQSNVG